MQIHFGRTLTIAAFAAFALSGCGTKDSATTTTTGTTTGTGSGTGSGTGTGTGTGTGSGTGSGTGTGTGSATGGTEAYGRMVHLIWDGGDVDIHLNDDATPINSAAFPVGGNTDASPSVGNDYVPFLTPGGSFQYNVKLRQQTGGADILDYDATLTADEYYTILAVGSYAASATTGVLINDSDYNSPTSGSHGLTVFQANPGFATQALDVFVCAVVDANTDGKTDPCDTSGTPDSAGLLFPANTTMIESTETTTFVTLAIPGVGPMAGYEVPTPVDAWSYLYIGINLVDVDGTPGPDNPAGTPFMLHHNHGTDNTPIVPVEWP